MVLFHILSPYFNISLHIKEKVPQPAGYETKSLWLIRPYTNSYLNLFYRIQMFGNIRYLLFLHESTYVFVSASNK